ncbi:hypothetical protein BDAG_00025 [Burkholderia dolosa AU0158]|nr:hypothetical protein BDAG_00025 [Burkholderia dolosa AU0158]
MTRRPRGRCGAVEAPRPRENPRLRASCQLAANAARYGASASASGAATRQQPCVASASGKPARLTFRCGCLASFRTGTFDFFSAKGRTMKKTLASIMTAAFALASVSAFAQASAPAADTSAAASAPAKKDHSKPKHQLKRHGSKKGQAKAAAASAAGTNDAGTQN